MEELTDFYITFGRYFVILRWAAPIGLAAALVMLWLNQTKSALPVRIVASVYACLAVAIVCLSLMQMFLLPGSLAYVSLCYALLWLAVLFLSALLCRRPNAQLLGAVALLVMAELLILDTLSHVVNVRLSSIGDTGLGAEQGSIAQAVLMCWFPFPFADGDVFRLGGYAVPRNYYLTWMAFRLSLMATTVLAYVVLSRFLGRSCPKCFSVNTGTARFCRYCGTALRGAEDPDDSGETARAK